MKVIGIILAIICFALLIIGHEFGHFSVGKLLGFKINEFAVGMGPKLWGKKKGETVKVETKAGKIKYKILEVSAQ